MFNSIFLSLKCCVVKCSVVAYLLVNLVSFSRENTFEYALQFSLEENEEDGIALDLTSLVIKDHEKRIPVDSV